jgi:hypothetical protein
VLDHRCDLWALATIAYEMLCRELPVEGNDVEEVMKNLCAGRIVPLQKRDPRIPAAVCSFFDRAFADRIDDRFEGAASLAQAFEFAAGGGSGVSMAPSSPSIWDTTGNTATEFSATVSGEALRMYSQRPTRIALAAAGAFAALVVAVVGIRSALHTEPGAPPAPDTVHAAAAPHVDPTPSSDWQPVPLRDSAVPRAVASAAPTAKAAAAQTQTPAQTQASPAPAQTSTPPHNPNERVAPALTAAQPSKPVLDSPAPPRPTRAAQTSPPAPSHATDDRNDVF